MRQHQKGFTLLELLIVLAITGAIIWPLSMAITTLLTNPQRTEDQNIVLQQVQNAGRWLSRDVQMSTNVTATAPRGFPLTITVPVDDIPAHNYTIDYLFVGSKLKRKQYNSSHVLVAETLVADYIVTTNTTFTSLTSDLYKLSIRASTGSAVVTTIYIVGQRL